MALINYKSEIPEHRVRLYEAAERNRQLLCRGEATEGSLAYARFLTACENDAAFNGFRKDDGEVARRWPFLAPLIGGSA